MNDHDEAVGIAARVIAPDGLDDSEARAVVAALARAGLLARPGELAALRAVAEAARARRGAQTGTDRLCRTQDLHDALAALDAAPAAGDASGEAWCAQCGHSMHNGRCTYPPCDG